MQRILTLLSIRNRRMLHRCQLGLPLLASSWCRWRDPLRPEMKVNWNQLQNVLIRCLTPPKRIKWFPQLSNLVVNILVDLYDLIWYAISFSGITHGTVVCDVPPYPHVFYSTFIQLLSLPHQTHHNLLHNSTTPKPLQSLIYHMIQ